PASPGWTFCIDNAVRYQRQECGRITFHAIVHSGIHRTERTVTLLHVSGKPAITDRPNVNSPDKSKNAIPCRRSVNIARRNYIEEVRKIVSDPYAAVILI